MNSGVIQALVDAATFIVSVSASAFIGGVRLGQLTGDIRGINERLARIEGMFTLRLKGDDK